ERVALEKAVEGLARLGPLAELDLAARDVEHRVGHRGAVGPGRDELLLARDSRAVIAQVVLRVARPVLRAVGERAVGIAGHELLAARAGGGVVADAALLLRRLAGALLGVGRRLRLRLRRTALGRLGPRLGLSRRHARLLKPLQARVEIDVHVAPPLGLAL